MSRCAHEKSDYKLRQLPKCSKCKLQFILIMASYETKPKPVYEWECPKCHKIVARHKLKEDQGTDFEVFLNERCKNEQRRQERKDKQRSGKTVIRNYNTGTSNPGTSD